MFEDRYGVNFTILRDSRTLKQFEFDKVLRTATAGSYRALVELAKSEITPKGWSYCRARWGESATEHFAYMAMAATVYARSVSDPPVILNPTRILLKTVAFCNVRCANRSKTGTGCRQALNAANHTLPKCIKIPRDIELVWRCLKRYIDTGVATNVEHALSGVEAQVGANFSPETSC